MQNKEVAKFHIKLDPEYEEEIFKRFTELAEEAIKQTVERASIQKQLLTSSRNRHFLPISFPQILPDKIRHFLSNQKLFVDVSFDNSRRPFEPILLGGEGGRGLLLRPLHRLRVHPTDPGSYLKSV